jgi:hypothetical protein
MKHGARHVSNGTVVPLSLAILLWVVRQNCGQGGANFSESLLEITNVLGRFIAT